VGYDGIWLSKLLLSSLISCNCICIRAWGHQSVVQFSVMHIHSNSLHLVCPGIIIWIFFILSRELHTCMHVFLISDKDHLMLCNTLHYYVAVDYDSHAMKFPVATYNKWWTSIMVVHTVQNVMLKNNAKIKAL